MLMFVISNIVGSTIQITTLPLPVLSTLQAVWLSFEDSGYYVAKRCIVGSRLQHRLCDFDAG
jgi:hypothetical protein